MASRHGPARPLVECGHGGVCHHLIFYLLHSTQVTGNRAQCSRALSCHFSFASCAMAAFVVNVRVLYPCQCTEPHDVSFPLACRLAYCLAMGFTGWVVTLRQAARRHKEGTICLDKRRWRSMHLAGCPPFSHYAVKACMGWQAAPAALSLLFACTLVNCLCHSGLQNGLSGLSKRPVSRCNAACVEMPCVLCAGGVGPWRFFIVGIRLLFDAVVCAKPSFTRRASAQACGPAFGRGFMPGAVKPAGTMSRENPKQPRGMMPRLG